MTKITNLNLPALLKTPGRYRVGDGMFLKVFRRTPRVLCLSLPRRRPRA